MADSTGHTKEQVIGKISKDALIALYDGDDIAEDYKKVRERLSDPDISNKDYAMLLRLVWEFTIAKPKQEIAMDHSTKGNPLTAGLILYPEGDVKVPTE